VTPVQEKDAMICRACGREERASEGYPCQGCGTFICNICNLRGVLLCRECQEKAGGAAASPRTQREPAAGS
jgi:hypothetical protein